MSEMIERVARALEPYAWANKGFSIRREISRQQARVAIEAMREPSKEMMRAMFEAMFEQKFDGTSAPMIGAGFEAAIDAALQEPTR